MKYDVVEAHEVGCTCSVCYPTLDDAHRLPPGNPRTEFYEIRVESLALPGRYFRIPRKPGMEPPEEIGVPHLNSLLYHRHIATAPDGTLIYG